MEAAAFVLLQLHETNKHATGHKETSRRPEAESGVWEPKKKKKSQMSPDPPRPPGLPGAPCAAWCHRRSLLHGVFFSLFLRHKSISSVSICLGSGGPPQPEKGRQAGGSAGDELGEFREGTRRRRV